jgi:hypothetical protein
VGKYEKYPQQLAEKINMSFDVFVGKRENGVVADYILIMLRMLIIQIN